MHNHVIVQLYQYFDKAKQIRMQINLYQLFPQLQIKLDPAYLTITPQDLQSNFFFTDLVEQIIQDYTNIANSNPKHSKKQTNNYLQLQDIHEFTQIKTLISKIIKKIIPIKIPKGTIIYTTGMPPDYGYFILHGCVQLMSKKNSWEKVEHFQGHTVHRPQQRVQYLQDNFHIDPKHFQLLENLFYQEKILFNYLPFRKLFSKAYFGFREIMGGCLRTKTAIATEQCILLKIKKQDYDKYLKEFQQKRQKYIISNMLSNIRTQIIEQIMPKLHHIFNSAEIITFDKGQLIIRQNQFCNNLYFLLSGQVLIAKDVKIQLPKKYLSNQNRGQFIKQMKINLHKNIKNSFVGEIQPLLYKKKREFSYQAISGNTTLIKFDSNSFTKVISESVSYQRQITIASKYKYSTTMEAFLSQKNIIIKSYFHQVQELDHRKKEKNVAVLLKNQGNFKQNQLYQLFKRQGAFFRDSFEKLEGFDQFQSKYDPKRSSIHRHKIKSTQQMQIVPQTHKKKQINYQSQKSSHNQSDISFEAMKKNLMSPVKSSNPFQILNAHTQSKNKLHPISQNQQLKLSKSTSTLRKKKRLFSKFKQLQKDQTIFKRVMIKNGQFSNKKEIDKSNRIQAIVNHKFDDIIKDCLTRKNIGIRKALVDHREDIVKQEFMRTVSSLPNRSASASHFQTTNFAFTCKGAQEMRKKLEKFKNLKGPVSTLSEKPSKPVKLQDCIGFNKKPQSSEIKQRASFISPSKNLQKSPSKIVLLNHMMKPITYTSAQI